MLKRHAILIANSVAYGVTGKNVPATVVNSIIKDFATRLDNLGDFTFETTTIVNENSDEAAHQIRDTIKRVSKTSDILLIYYFGHAVRSPESDDDLYLFFKDSDWLDLPSMLDFRDIVKWLRSYKPPKVVIALDCCYAGVVRNQLRLLDEYGGQYYLMASVTNRGKAEVDYENNRPIGVFSKYLLSGFSNPAARIPLGHDVTFESLFSFVSAKTQSQSQQLPFSVDNGLAREIFFKQVLAPTIAPGIRASVPKKSAYHKLFILSSFFLAKQFDDESSLYSFMSSREPREFLTPVKVNPNTIKYQFMGEDAFFWYVDLCRELGILNSGTPIKLTVLGKSMMRRDGDYFNKGLFDAVKAAWKKHNVDLTDLEQAISVRMRLNGIPTVDSIYFEMYVTKKLRMSKEYFRVLLDLTAYIGALRYSREHTFFLPTISGYKEEEGDY
jgi:hypothetical protein